MNLVGVEVTRNCGHRERVEISDELPPGMLPIQVPCRKCRKDQANQALVESLARPDSLERRIWLS